MLLNWGGSLRGKYTRSNILERDLDAKVYDFCLWKNNVSLWPILENLSYWDMGNGTKIKALSDCWVALGIKLEEYMTQSNATI